MVAVREVSRAAASLPIITTVSCCTHTYGSELAGSGRSYLYGTVDLSVRVLLLVMIDEIVPHVLLQVHPCLCYNCKS